QIIYISSLLRLSSLTLHLLSPNLSFSGLGVLQANDGRRELLLVNRVNQCLFYFYF
ncbi:hypothetical protein GIB67_018575, partial [Kingdonia uniflora]